MLPAAATIIAALFIVAQQQAALQKLQTDLTAQMEAAAPAGWTWDAQAQKYVKKKDGL